MYAAATAEQKYYTIGELHDLIEEEYHPMNKELLM